MWFKFNDLSKIDIQKINFPEWDEIDINVPDLADQNEIYLYIRLNNADLKNNLADLLKTYYL